jgi:hypothetical protein
VSQTESKNLRLLLEKSSHIIERLKFKSETGVLRSLPLQEEKQLFLQEPGHPRTAVSPSWHFNVTERSTATSSIQTQLRVVETKQARRSRVGTRVMGVSDSIDFVS